MNASDVPTAADLLQRRAQLESRLSQVNAVTTIVGMFSLVDGTGLDGEILAQAKLQVSAYLTNTISTIEGQLTGLGVVLGA